MKKLLVALLVAGCSSEPIGPDPTSGQGGNGGSVANNSGGNGAGTQGGTYESGSRLKARTLAGADGSRSPAGWYDSELETECTWAKDEAGQQRCMPVGPLTFLYADSACTVPVVADDGCNAPAFVRTRPSGCVDEFRVFRVGRAHSNSDPLYSLTANGCSAVGMQSGFVGEEIAASELVAAELETEQ